MNDTNNRPTSQMQLIGRWRVIYMGEIPGYPGILGKTQLSLFDNGFSLSSEKLGNHFFYYSDVISWVVLKERSAYAAANPNAFFKPRHIRIQYLDNYGATHTILLEMCESIFLPKNAEICRSMVALMNQHGIFGKFAPIKQASSSMQSNASVNIMSQIEKLAELHKSGVLTDEEFQSKKTDLLSRI